MADEQEPIIEAAEEPVEVAEEAPALPSIEDLAAELGWKPEDQWKGDPAEWRDPAAFIRHGQNGPLVKKLAAIEKSHERLVRTTAAATERLLAEQAAEINARWQQAVEDGDHKAVREAERDLAKVQAERNQPDPMVADFIERNGWYNVDPDATDYAAAVTQRLAAQGKNVSEQLEAAEAAVRKRFPELFEDKPQQQQRQAPQVHAPASRTAAPSKRAKGVTDLPRDARQAGEEVVRMAQTKGFKYTLDDYARTYWSEKGEVA